MDPLSVAASVVGLLSAAGKVYSLLEIISSARHAPATIRDAQLEVKHVEIALRSLQRYLWRLELADLRRRDCIWVDELIVALGDAMLVFSEFETTLAELSRLTQARTAISWFRYSKQINEHTVKAQRNKASLTFMLNILQCESDLEASQSQERLQVLIEQVLADNDDLRQKMGQMNDTFDARSTFTRANPEIETIRRYDNGDGSDTSTIRGIGRSNSVRSVRTSILRFAFENILEKSWVYKRNHNNECDRSFISSDQRSHAWSCFSGYSLADISVLSVIAMPFTQHDMANGKHYNIEFGINFPGLASEAENVDTRNDETVDNRLLVALAAPEDRSPDPKANDVNVKEPHSNADSTTWGAIAERESRSLETSEHIAGDTKSGRSSRLSDDYDVFICKGCHEVLEEGKAFELAGNRWHIECFRCDTCDSPLDSDANLLLMGDGLLICNKCTYNCSACDNKIEDLAILTGDQAFCAGCFRCTNCKKKIEDLRYAKTSQGFVCMPCHEYFMARQARRITQKKDLIMRPLPKLPPSRINTISEDKQLNGMLNEDKSIFDEDQENFLRFLQSWNTA